MRSQFFLNGSWVLWTSIKCQCDVGCHSTRSYTMHKKLLIQLKTHIRKLYKQCNDASASVVAKQLKGLVSRASIMKPYKEYKKCKEYRKCLGLAVLQYYSNNSNRLC